MRLDLSRAPVDAVVSYDAHAGAARIERANDRAYLDSFGLPVSIRGYYDF